MTHENRRTVLRGQRLLRDRNVICQRGGRILDDCYVVAVLLENRFAAGLGLLSSRRRPGLALASLLTGNRHRSVRGRAGLAQDFAIFCGNASRRLGEAIARTLGVPAGNAVIERFPDGEISVDIEDTVRHKDVFIVQSMAPPVNDHLMEILA
jgi:hypothetical protein